MMKLTRWLPTITLWQVVGICLLPLILGCPPPADDENGLEGTETGSATSASSEAAAEEEPDVLLEPFDPPPLDELEASVEWEDQPVLDAMELYRKYKAEHPPLATVEEALALKNDSPEANEKILTTLGQPPASESEVDYDAALRRFTPLDIKSSNPILGSSVTEFEVNDLTSFGLFAFDWNFYPFATAEHVKSWQSSKDRLFDKVVLRDDLVWSDGKPITAHDVEFTFQTIMNPKVPVVAVRSGVDELKWVKAYDDHTVVFFHKESLATNVWNMLFPIIPRHAYADSMKEDPSLSKSDYHLKLEQAPVCGGPYKISSRVRNQEIILTRREDYFMKDGVEVRRKPYFKEIRFRVIEDLNTALLALEKGEIDDLELNPEQWDTQTKDDEFYAHNTKAYGVGWGHAYIGWNLNVPFFSDKRVRQAMSYALDHEEMIENICYGVYEYGRGVYHPTAWMAPNPMPEPYHQSLDKAEELLDAAGWTDSDGDGIRDKEIDGKLVPFEFTITIANASQTGIKICELLKSNLDQIGVICNIKPTEFTVLQEQARNHKFQAQCAGWGTGADPASGKNLWTTKAIEQNGRNYVSYSNPRVDELFELGEREFDRDKRAKIYGEIATILWDDQPYTWLYFRSNFFAWNKDVRGYMFSPRGPYGYSPGLSALWKPK
ncbi:MAG: peptide-binding protein [Planctomycetaceae bacterium]